MADDYANLLAQQATERRELERHHAGQRAAQRARRWDELHPAAYANRVAAKSNYRKRSLHEGAHKQLA